MSTFEWIILIFVVLIILAVILPDGQSAAIASDDPQDGTTSLPSADTSPAFNDEDDSHPLCDPYDPTNLCYPPCDPHDPRSPCYQSDSDSQWDDLDEQTSLTTDSSFHDSLEYDTSLDSFDSFDDRY